MLVFIINTDPGNSLQSLLNIIILIETVIVIESELVKPRCAGITIMQILPCLFILNISSFLLKSPSLESDVVSEVSPDGGGGADPGSCGQAAG